MSRLSVNPFDLAEPRKATMPIGPFAIPQGPSAGIDPLSVRGRAVEGNRRAALRTIEHLTSLPAPATPTASPTAGQITFAGKTIQATPGDVSKEPQRVTALRRKMISDARDEADFLSDAVKGENFTFNKGMLADANERSNSTTAAGNALTTAQAATLGDWSKHVLPFQGQEAASRAKVNEANAARISLLAPVEERTGKLAADRFAMLTPWTVTAAEQGLADAGEQVKGYKGLISDQSKVIDSLKSGHPSAPALKPSAPFVRTPQDLQTLYMLTLDTEGEEAAKQVVREQMPGLLGRTGQDPRFAGPFEVPSASPAPAPAGGMFSLTPPPAGPTTRPTTPTPARLAGPTTRPTYPFDVPPDASPSPEAMSLASTVDSAGSIGQGPGAAIMQAGPWSQEPVTISPAFAGQAALNATIAPSTASQAMPTPKTPQEAMKLPPGTRFRDPHGIVRIR